MWNWLCFKFSKFYVGCFWQIYTIVGGYNFLLGEEGHMGQKIEFEYTNTYYLRVNFSSSFSLNSFLCSPYWCLG